MTIPKRVNPMRGRTLLLLGAFLLAGCDADEPNTTADAADTTAIAGLEDGSDTADRSSPGADTVGRTAPETTYRFDSVIVPGPRPPRGSDAPRLVPLDEAGAAPDFVVYRMRFAEAVGARDTSALYELMSADVHLSFGGARGRSGFREMWNPSDPDSDVWMHLGRVLGGGGLYEEGPIPAGDGRTASARFTAPYYFAAFPGDRFDAFQHGVVTGPAVPVREEPEPDAAVLETLSYTIVRVPSFEPLEGSWIRIELEDRRSGFVRARQIESPLGYRAVFHRVDGRWEMTAFVAGD